MPEESPPHLLAEIFRHVVVDKGIGAAVEGADGQAHHVADVQVAVQLGVIAGVVNEEENVAGRVESHQHEQHESRELDRVGVFLPAAQEGSQHGAVAEQHHQQRSEESAGDQAGEVVEVKPLVLVPGEHVVAEGDVRAVQGVRLLLQRQGQREDGGAEPDGSAGAGGQRRGAERARKERVHHRQVPVDADAREQQHRAVHVPVEERGAEPAQAFTERPVVPQEIVENLEGQHQGEQQVCRGQVQQKDGGGELLGAGGQHPERQRVGRQPQQENQGVEAGDEPHRDRAAQLRACGLGEQQVCDVVDGGLFSRDGSGTRRDLRRRYLLVGAVLGVI